MCTCCSHLFIDLICIQCFPVGVSARVKRTHKLIVVNEAIAIQVEDVCHCIHLQSVCGKFYRRWAERVGNLEVGQLNDRDMAWQTFKGKYSSIKISLAE